MEEMPDWVIVQRPGMTPDRKGPFPNEKCLEEMLRELYKLYPDCCCTVIAMPHTSYPQSGREWLDMYGDKRRKKLPRPRMEKWRGLLLWALYHHQGASSDVGQPIRKALGIGQCDRLTEEQLATAKASGGVPSNVKLSGPEAALSPEGRARTQGYASAVKTEEGK